MIQYGYANFEKRGYRVASENAFFHSGGSERQQALSKLMRNVSGPTQNRISYLGIRTDLGISSENPRFYFQMSGQEAARSADFAQGYVWDVKENYIFGRDFPKILQLRFMERETLCSLPVRTCEGAFPDIALTDAPCLPDGFCRAVLGEEILGDILERLLQGQKVLLRLNKKGEEADRLARQVLWQVYGCLPYGVRECAGFCTNVTAVRFCGEKEDRLAEAVGFCLADRDAPLPDTVPGYAVLDMESPLGGKCREAEREEFLRFLMRDGKREDYFEHLFSAVEEGWDGGVPLQLYEDYFYLYRMPNGRREALSNGEVFGWCEWYGRNRIGNDRIKAIFLGKIRESLTEKEMQNFLWNKDNLEKLMPPRNNEEPLADLSQYTEEAEKVFGLFEDICKKYLPDPQDGMRRLGTILTEYLLEWTGADCLVKGCQNGPDAEGRCGGLEELERLARLTESQKDDRSVLGLAWEAVYSQIRSVLGEVKEEKAQKERQEEEREKALLSEFADAWNRKAVTLDRKLELLWKLEKGEYPAAGRTETFYQRAAGLVQEDWANGKYGGAELLRNLSLCRELAQIRKESVRDLVEALWRIDLFDKRYCEGLLKNHEEWESLAVIFGRKANLYYDTKLLVCMEAKEAVSWLENLFQKYGNGFGLHDVEELLEQGRNEEIGEGNPEDRYRMEEPISKQADSLGKEEEQDRDGVQIGRFWAAGTVLLACELAAALWVVSAWFRM